MKELEVNPFSTHYPLPPYRLKEGDSYDNYRDQVDDYLNQCCYCIDAPNYFPRGSTKDLQYETFLILTDITGRHQLPMRDPYGG